MNYPNTFDEMVQAMLRCEQTQGQSVYQHGLSVWEHVRELLDYMRDGSSLTRQWKLPSWLEDYKSDIVAVIGKTQDVQLYCMYHDCGKPYCRTVDEAGKVHFPNHAAVSREVYLHVGGDERIANLIGWDMVLHTAKAEEIERYMNEEWSMRDAIILVVAALAEIHSNARLFGGIESESFKIKWKQLDRRGKQVCKHYFTKEMAA